MQIREQGRQIQCIRSTYDATIKRSRQKVVAVIERWSDHMPLIGLDELSDTERQELAEWFDAKRAKAVADHQKWAVTGAPQVLENLAKAIRATDTLDVNQIDAIKAGLADVMKALRKAGPQKPHKATQKAENKPLPGQKGFDLSVLDNDL